MDIDLANHEEIDCERNPLGRMTPSGLRRMIFNMINALAIRGLDLFPLSTADTISHLRELFFTAIDILYVHAPDHFPRTEDDLTEDELWVLKSAAADFTRYLCYNIEDDEIPEELTLFQLDGMVYFRLDFLPLMMRVISVEDQSTIREVLPRHVESEKIIFEKYMAALNNTNICESNNEMQQYIVYERAYSCELQSLVNEYSLDD